MIPKVSDIEGEPIVGKFYLVPCVYHTGIDKWIPIVGPAHDDKEYIGVATVHYHRDIRFESSQHIGYLSNPRIVEPSSERYAMICIVPLPKLKGDIVFKRRKCLRRMLDFPIELRYRHTPLLNTRAPWFPKIEAAYKDTPLSSCLKCPHRGMPLANLPKDEHGNVVCNGHGLKWNLETGRMVSRIEQHPMFQAVSEQP